MSRHRFVRNINIHDELDDDFDHEEDPFEGITPAQQAQLDSATDSVVNLLGPERDSLIAEGEIRKKLWDVYFDVDDTLAWAFDEQKRRKSAKDKKDDALPVNPPDTLGASKPAKPLSALAQMAAKSKPSSSKTSLASLAAQRSLTAPMALKPSSPAAKSLGSLATPRASANVPTRSVMTPPNLDPPPSKPVTKSKLAALAQSRSRQPLATLPSSLPSISASSDASATLPTKPPSKLAMKIQAAKGAAASATQPAISAAPAIVRMDEDATMKEAENVPLNMGVPSSAGLEDHELEVDSLFAPPSRLFSVSVDSADMLSSLRLDDHTLWKAPPSPFAMLLIPRPSSSPPPHRRAKSSGEKNGPDAGTVFTFETPSPDDIVLQKRGGTRLAAVAKFARGSGGERMKSGTDKKAAAKAQQHTSQPTSRSATPTPKKAIAGGGSKASPVATAPNTPKKSLLNSVATSNPASKNSSPLAKPQQTQLQADMEGLNLEGEDPQGVVADDLPPPKMSLTREKVLEEARKAIEGAGSSDAKKKGLSLVIVGHVDAGKSTMMGRLMYDLGQMEERKRRENERESTKAGKGSFMWAWEMDALGEERERGVTIDINQTTLNLPQTSLTILDAPGHRDFIPNMISGASQADAALLVVDATVGEFEAGFAGGGQSREHVLLVRSLGVGMIVVAVNKMDMVNYSKARFDEICATLKPFLAQSGYQSLKTAFVPCAGMAGVNLVERDEQMSKVMSWWTGPTLVSALDALTPPGRPIEAPLRFPISNVFKGGGSGSIATGVGVSGRLASGVIQVGERLRILPGDESAVVRTIENEEKSVPWAAAGSNVTLYLANVDPVHLRSGTLHAPTAKPVSIPIEPFAINKDMGRILLRRGGETIAAGIVSEIFS
ncbi:Hsp70 suppressor, GTPase facilitates ribosomal subunit dissociation [Tulasnella sp. 330]|nr:Hsp70 suppressor, GTPase facilitates ribosomal subunit dissociation [Tulasnella sp. 330]